MRQFILIILLFISANIFSQAKGYIYSVNYGIQNIKANRDVIYPVYFNDEGGYVTGQLNKNFIDINFLLSMPICIRKENCNSRLRGIVGLDWNQKGFVITGMEYDGGGKYYPITEVVVSNYIGVFGGFSFDLIRYKNLKVAVSQILNPEFSLKRYSVEKRLPLGTRSLLMIDYDLGPDLGLKISPYFQASLSDYFRPSPTYGNYWPYGYGLSLGLVFR